MTNVQEVTIRREARQRAYSEKLTFLQSPISAFLGAVCIFSFVPSIFTFNAHAFGLALFILLVVCAYRAVLLNIHRKTRFEEIYDDLYIEKGKS